MSKLDELLAEARVWQALAISLHDENRQLRQWLTAIILRVAERDELYAYGLALIAERWPERQR